MNKLLPAVGWWLAALTGILINGSSYTTGGQPRWTNWYNGPGDAADGASALAVDSAGNLYVAGSSGGDFAIVAYSHDGAALWTNRYAGAGNSVDSPVAVTVDVEGRVIVTGSAGAQSPASDYVTIAYSGDGMPLWTNRFNGRGSEADTATGLAVDVSGTVFVAGYSYYTTNTLFAGIWNIPEYATVAYSSAGEPLWTNYYNLGNGAAWGIAVTSRGTVIVGGYSAGGLAAVAYSGDGIPLWTNRLAGTDTYVPVMISDDEGNVWISGSGLTVAYSSTGQLLWTHSHYAAVGAITVDKQKKVFIAISLLNGMTSDIGVIAYSASGTILWTNSYNGPGNGRDTARDMAVDSHGNVVLTGYSVGSSGLNEILTIGYSNSGGPLWTNRYAGAGAGSWAQSSAAVADRFGNVYVAGTEKAGSGADFVVIKCATPAIGVERSETGVVLRWSSALTGFVPQERAGLAEEWTDIAQLPIADGPTIRVSVPSTDGTRFFRLRR